ncbi:MAG: hypothetical protein JOS17DRAFT_344595 [Linnemannia elongata]|nr:MAG: hypothetical protein JOS17DRAFT_344595 [Linnemannia elongata]
MALLDSSRRRRSLPMGLPSVHPAEEGSSITPLASPLAPAAEDLQQRSPSAHPQQEKLLHRQEFPHPIGVILPTSTLYDSPHSHDDSSLPHGKAMDLTWSPSSHQQHQQKQQQQDHSRRPILDSNSIDHFQDASAHRVGSKQFSGLSPSSAPTTEPSSSSSLEPATFIDRRSGTTGSPTMYNSSSSSSSSLDRIAPFIRPYHYDRGSFDFSPSTSSSSFRQPIEAPSSTRHTRRDHPSFSSSQQQHYHTSFSSKPAPVEKHGHHHGGYSSQQDIHSASARTHPPPPESVLARPGEISTPYHDHSSTSGYITLDRSLDETSGDHRRRRPDVTNRPGTSPSSAMDPPYHYSSSPYPSSSSSTSTAPVSSSSSSSVEKVPAYRRPYEDSSVPFPQQRGSQTASPLSPLDRTGAQHRRPVVRPEALDRSFAHPSSSIDHSIEPSHFSSLRRPFDDEQQQLHASSALNYSLTGGQTNLLSQENHPSEPRRSEEEPTSFAAAYGPSSPTHFHHQLQARSYDVSAKSTQGDHRRDRRPIDNSESSFAYPHGPQRHSYSHPHPQQTQHFSAPVQYSQTHGAPDQPYPYSSSSYGPQSTQNYPHHPHQQQQRPHYPPQQQSPPHLWTSMRHINNPINLPTRTGLVHRTLQAIIRIHQTVLRLTLHPSTSSQRMETHLLLRPRSTSASP